MGDLPPQPFEHPGWRVRRTGKTWWASRFPAMPAMQADVGGRYQTVIADDEDDLRSQLAEQDAADAAMLAPAKATVAA